jgi:hypothetical protein
MSRIETGEGQPTPRQVRALLAAYKAAAPEAYSARQGEAQRIVDEVDAAASEFTDARVVLQAGGAHNFQRRIHEAETRSRLVRAYQSATILGILQTRDYVEAVFTPDDQMTPADAAASVQARLARQADLRDESRHWHLVQTEWALRSPIQSYELQAAQLDHLAEVSELPNVRLGVIPLDTVIRYPGPMTGFHLFDDRMVQVGTDTGTALIEDPERVAPYVNWFGELQERAVHGDRARGLLARIAARYRRLET